MPSHPSPSPPPPTSSSSHLPPTTFINTTNINPNNPHPIRARHTIRLSSIRHNYNIVSSAANKQKCSVIVVVKADAYGHGAIETALHLADYCGADAFAVATIEEGIGLRKAFMETANNNNNNGGVVVGGGSIGGLGGVAAAGGGQQPTSITSPSLFFTPPTITTIPNTTITPSKDNKKMVLPKNIDIQSQSDYTTTTIATTSTSIPTSNFKQLITNNNSTTTNNNVVINPMIPTRKRIRSNQIRILVLGPPTNIPNDFNLYLHYNIEVMISSTKMARALMEWVADCDGRKIAEVDQVANERKKELLLIENNEKEDSNGCCGGGNGGVNYGAVGLVKNDVNRRSATLTGAEGTALGKEIRALLKAKDTAATAAVIVPTSTTVVKNNNAQQIPSKVNNVNSDNKSKNLERKNRTEEYNDTNTTPQKNTNARSNNNNTSNNIDTNNPPFPFKGIEDIAKESRTRELAAAKLMAHFTGENHEDEDDDILITTDNDSTQANITNFHETLPNDQDQMIKGHDDNESQYSFPKTSPSSSVLIVNEDDLDDSLLVSTVSSAVAKSAIDAATNNTVPLYKARKKLRWHILVDSGMGRLGFKSIEEEEDDDNNKTSNGGCNRVNTSAMFLGVKVGPNGEKIVEKWKAGPHKDTVSIIKAMCHAEIDGAPIEFHGMCTHMAEASSNSNYTNEQMTRFKSLLKSVRQANISVPTISTDNSAALLTTSLTHFDPIELLSQPNADTRGYVRTGGAVYGQRPAFTQLRAVSTLTASVRHVSTIMKGETVGYDRAYKAEKNVRIATLSIGFADGYPRELGNGKGKVSIHGQKFPIAGNVCMDMLMVDLGCVDDLSVAGSLVSIGDTAYLWGPEVDDEDEGCIRLQDVAESLNTTQSALTCGLDKTRVQRHYID